MASNDLAAASIVATYSKERIFAAREDGRRLQVEGDDIHNVVSKLTEQHRKSLRHVLADSRELVKNVQRVCFSRNQKDRCMLELRKLQICSVSASAGFSVTHLLDQLRTSRKFQFTAPADEPILLVRLRTMYILLLHRSESSMSEFKQFRKELWIHRTRVAQTESLHLFLLLEKRLTTTYLSNEEKLYAHRSKLKKYLSDRKGFIRTEFMDDDGTFAEANYLSNALEDSVRNCQHYLRKNHADLQELLTQEVSVSATLLQHLWRLKCQRNKVQRTQQHWLERHEHMKNSKLAFTARKGMLFEDHLASRVRELTKGAIAVQRQFRIFLRNKQREHGKTQCNLTVYQVKKRDEEKLIDEMLKEEMRKEIQSMKELEAWRCPHCARMGMAPRRSPFKSWELVNQHLADHQSFLDMKQKLKEDKLERINASWKKNLDKERVFLRELRRNRAERDRNRLQFCLLKASIVEEKQRTEEWKCEDWIFTLNQISGHGIILNDGENCIGRSKKRCKHFLDSSLFPNLISKHHLTIHVERKGGMQQLFTGISKVELSASVVDKDSTNGTSLNDTVMEKDKVYELNVGDELILGSCPDNPFITVSDVKFVVGYVDCL